MEYHCQYCMCPKEIWKPCVNSYQGDECHLYDSFLSLIEDGMTIETLTELAIEELPKEFSDIEDIGELVKELVDVAIDCGVLG